MNRKIGNVINESLCTGCGACIQICPIKAIKMKPNDEGFLYPEINESQCTHCELCKKVCPMLNLISMFKGIKYRKCFAICADMKTRNTSSRGGVFEILENTILREDGFICGAAFEKDFRVNHIIANSESD